MLIAATTSISATSLSNIDQLPLDGGEAIFCDRGTKCRPITIHISHQGQGRDTHQRCSDRAIWTFLFSSNTVETTSLLQIPWLWKLFYNSKWQCTELYHHTQEPFMQTLQSRFSWRVTVTTECRPPRQRGYQCVTLLLHSQSTK